jgi:hypothetical protein
VRAELDGQDAGIHCVSPKAGPSLATTGYTEHDKMPIVGFDQNIQGKILKLFVHETSLADGWAVYAMQPTVSCAATAAPPSVGPTAAQQLQTQIDTLTATVAALTTRLDSCGSCNHLEVSHDGTSNVEVSAKYGSAGTGGKANFNY